MRLGLVGYFGYGNYGDEIFLKVWRDLFGYENTQVIYPGDDLNNIDKIIIGGGDLIHPSFINNNYWKDEFFAKDVYIYGVSVPLQIKGINEGVIEKYKELFAKAKYVSVRDEASAEWLRKNTICNPNIVEDMAWAFSSQVKVPKQIQTVGITYRPCGVSIDDIMRYVCYLKDKGWKKILMIPLQDGYHSTREWNLALKEKLLTITPYINVIPLADIEHKYAYIGSVELYITTAFHGLLTGLATNIPTISILDDNKFVQLANRLDMQCCKTFNNFIAYYESTLFQKFDDNLQRKINDIKSSSLKSIQEFKGLVLC